MLTRKLNQNLKNRKLLTRYLKRLTGVQKKFTHLKDAAKIQQKNRK